MNAHLVFWGILEPSMRYQHLGGGGRRLRNTRPASATPRVQGHLGYRSSCLKNKQETLFPVGQLLPCGRQQVPSRKTTNPNTGLEPWLDATSGTPTPPHNCPSRITRALLQESKLQPLHFVKWGCPLVPVQSVPATSPPPNSGPRTLGR